MNAYFEKGKEGRGKRERERQRDGGMEMGGFRGDWEVGGLGMWKRVREILKENKACDPVRGCRRCLFNGLLFGSD